MSKRPNHFYRSSVSSGSIAVSEITGSTTEGQIRSQRLQIPALSRLREYLQHSLGCIASRRQPSHHIRQPIHICCGSTRAKLQTPAHLGAHLRIVHRVLRAALDGVAFEFNHFAILKREFDARGFDSGGLIARSSTTLVMDVSAAMLLSGNALAQSTAGAEARLKEKNIRYHQRRQQQATMLTQ